jgi:hypothetical protein
LLIFIFEYLKNMFFGLNPFLLAVQWDFNFSSEISSSCDLKKFFFLGENWEKPFRI